MAWTRATSTSRRRPPRALSCSIKRTAEKDDSPHNDNFDPHAPENKDSALIWHFGGPGDPNTLGRNYYFGRTMSTAAIRDGLVYIAELAGYLHCLDAQTGKEYWQHN